MRDSDEKKCKKQELINNFDFTEASLKQAEDYFQTKNIPFVAKENTTFTLPPLRRKSAASSVISLLSV